MKNIISNYLFVIVLGLSLFNKTNAQEIDVLKYSIHLTTTSTQNKNISAYTEVKFKSETDNLQQLELMLQHLTVDSVKSETDLLNYTHNDNILNIELNQPLSANEIDSITVYYHGTAMTDASGWGGVYATQGYLFNLGVSMNESPHTYGRVWFPCVDNFTDKALYEYYITCPNNQKAVCGGSLISETNNDDNSHTFHWSLNHPISTYLAAFAVGDYNIHSSFIEGTYNNLPVLIYTRPNDTANVNGSFIHLKNALHFFENRFGKYGWSRIGYVGVPFGGGAMEHAENIAYPNSAINGNIGQETLMAHEFSHHWFGNLVTCDSAKDMWLNEGWASYCESIFLEDLYGLKKAQQYNRQRHKDNLHFLHKNEGGYLAVANIPDQYTYGGHVYKKGADMVHTLRHYLSDSTFNRLISAYLDTFRYQNSNSSQLREFINTHCAINVDAFFQDWIFTGGWSHFSIDSFSVEPYNHQYKVNVFIRQKLKGKDSYATQNRIPIQFMGSDFQRKDTIMMFSGRNGQQTFTVDFEPKAVFCDLDEQVADATTDEAYMFKNPEEKNFETCFFKSNCTEVSDSSLLRVQHHWVGVEDSSLNINGLNIHPSRYWTIEGVFSDIFKANGQFYFCKYSFQNLDYGFISGSSDSLVLLHRPLNTNQWEIVVEESNNRSSEGYITIDHLKTGDYVLGYKNGYSEIKENTLNNNILIYPNPNKGMLNVKINNNIKYEKIKILDIKNHSLIEQKIDKKEFKVDINQLKTGVYIVYLESENNTFVRKIIKQ